VLRQLLW
jgi:hypothetical protein